MTGKFIVFEGVDGCGKTTQRNRYRSHLRDRGVVAVGSGEPYGTTGAFIHHVLGGGAPLLGDRASLAKLFAASRREHAAAVIRPALAAGEILLCDRYLPSSLAYQGQGSEPRDGWIAQINAWNAGIPVPDLTIVFTVSPEEAARRIALRGGAGDLFDGGKRDEIAQRCEMYARLEEYGEVGRVVRIDAGAHSDTVQSRVRALLDPLIFGEGGQ